MSSSLADCRSQLNEGLCQKNANRPSLSQSAFTRCQLFSLSRWSVVLQCTIKYVCLMVVCTLTLVSSIDQQLRANSPFDISYSNSL